MKTRTVCNATLVALLLVTALMTGCTGGPQAAGPTPAASPQQPTPTTAVESEGMGSPDYGVHVFLWGSPSVERDLRMATDAGFGWVKQMFQWNYIEGNEKGKLTWEEPDRLAKAAQNAGLRVLARVDISPVWARDPSSDLTVSGPPQDLQDFSDFMFALASRYKKGSSNGRIHAYQIWNEPNLAREWGGKQPDAKEYVELLKVGYEAVKKADPDALVISAGLAPTTESSAMAIPDVQFLKEMYEVGAKNYFDVLGAHGAGYKAPPEMSPDEVAADPQYNHGEGEAGRIYCFRHVEDLRQIMTQYDDDDKMVALLEFGWTSDNRPGSPYEWHSVTEEQKADYIVRAFEYASKNWTPWIGVMNLIYICNPQWSPHEEQYYWAITNPDGTVRPAYDAIKRMLKQ